MARKSKLASATEGAVTSAASSDAKGVGAAGSEAKGTGTIAALLDDNPNAVPAAAFAVTVVLAAVAIKLLKNPEEEDADGGKRKDKLPVDGTTLGLLAVIVMTLGPFLYSYNKRKLAETRRQEQASKTLKKRRKAASLVKDDFESAETPPAPDQPKADSVRDRQSSRFLSLIWGGVFF